jgi:four helix bundle protein
MLANGRISTFEYSQRSQKVQTFSLRAKIRPEIRDDSSGTRAAACAFMHKPWDLAERTMDFAVAVFWFCRELPQTEEAREIARQLRRAAASVGANYRAVRRGRSTRDFASKIGVVIEEADESGFWLDFIVRVELLETSRMKALAQEANELVAIFTASQKTARSRMKKG